MSITHETLFFSIINLKFIALVGGGDIYPTRLGRALTISISLASVLWLHPRWHGSCQQPGVSCKLPTCIHMFLICCLFGLALNLFGVYAGWFVFAAAVAVAGGPVLQTVSSLLVLVSRTWLCVLLCCSCWSWFPGHCCCCRCCCCFWHYMFLRKCLDMVPWT